MGKVTSNADTVTRLVHDKLVAGLEAVARRAKELHQEDLSRDYPPASVPSEFPARRTHNLQRSVDYGVDESIPRAAMGYIRGQAEYHKGLIRSGRLGPAATVTENVGELRQAFIQGANSVS